MSTVYTLRKIVGTADYLVQFKNIVTRYKKTGYKMNILPQTACIVVIPIMFDRFASLDGGSVLRLIDGSLLNLFQ